MSASETIDLPHGVGAALDNGDGQVAVNESDEHDGFCYLIVCNRHRRDHTVIALTCLLPAERRWLAAELLFGLEEEPEQRAPTPWIGRREEQRA